MVQAGLIMLTGQSSPGGIWGQLFGNVNPNGYTPGQRIAIKVNFNNSSRNGNSCSTHNNVIDALPQPILALISSMVSAGVQASDIIIYDASAREGRLIPYYFRNPITSAYSGVNFVGKDDCGATEVSYGVDPSLTVTFPGTSIENRLMPDLLYYTTYLINVPILKAHSGIPMSLGFKNHMGSINYVTDSGSDDLHQYFDPAGNYYSQYYNPMVTVYQHSHIAPKTMLTMGDCLFGAFGVTESARNSWSVFGDQAANSLFFARDPVSIDCVMADVLRAEGVVSTSRAYDYLFCAQEAGLGTCEGSRGSPGGNPFQLPYGSGYSTIQYTRQDTS